MKKRNIINFLVILFLTVFPLIFDNYYFNITITKYKVFAVLALGIFFLGAAYSIFRAIDNGFSITSVSFKETFRRLTPADKLMVLFLLSCTISCLLSEWKLPSFSGVCGKYIGLFFLLLCGGMYYGITRHMTITRAVLLSFPAVLSIVSVMAVLQFCGYDVLGFYKNMSAGTSVMYIATFGHVDVFSAFLCVYLPVCLFLFCHSGGKDSLIYGISCLMGFLGVFSANSDSSYLGVILSLAFLLILCFADAQKLQYYSILLWIYALAAGIWKLLHIFATDIRTESSITAACSSISAMIVAALTALVLFWLSGWFLKRKKKTPKVISLILGFVMLTGVLLLFASLLWFSIADTKTNLGIMENYLRFDVHWGSDRGYVWKWLWSFFCFSPLLIKLFGAGPDTTTLILYQNFKKEMSEELGVFYASAHNEYLNYLVTIGLIGTLLYIGVVLMSILRCFKRQKENVFFGAVGLGILSYSAMAVVNISQPITVPFLYLLVAFANIQKK